jgi:hypothetical protein
MVMCHVHVLRAAFYITITYYIINYKYKYKLHKLHTNTQRCKLRCLYTLLTKPQQQRPLRLELTVVYLVLCAVVCVCALCLCCVSRLECACECAWLFVVCWLIVSATQNKTKLINLNSKIQVICKDVFLWESIIVAYPPLLFKEEMFNKI